MLVTGMKPTICKTCGKAEWNHVCAGSGLIPVTRAVVSEVVHGDPADAVAPERRVAVRSGPAASPALIAAPRGDAPDQIRGTPDTVGKALHQAGSPSPDMPARGARRQRPVPSPGKPDTWPSDLSVLSDEELRPYFNEVMRRKMKLRRAKP
jgi:hypothetical protein